MKRAAIVALGVCAMIGSGVIAESQSANCVLLREQIASQVVRVKHSAATLQRWTQWRVDHPAAAARLDVRQRRARLTIKESLEKFRIACSWTDAGFVAAPPDLEPEFPAVEPVEPEPPSTIDQIIPDMPPPDYVQPDETYDGTYTLPPYTGPIFYEAGWPSTSQTQPIVATQTPEPSSLWMALTGLIFMGSARIIWKQSASPVDNSGA